MFNALYVASLLSLLNGRFVEYDAAYKAFERGRPMVVILSADWCQPCQKLKAKAESIKDASVVVLNIERDKIAERFPRVKSLPTTYVFSKRTRTQVVVGGDDSKLREAVRRALE